MCDGDHTDLYRAQVTFEVRNFVRRIFVIYLCDALLTASGKY